MYVLQDYTYLIQQTLPLINQAFVALPHLLDLLNFASSVSWDTRSHLVGISMVYRIGMVWVD